MTTFTDKLETGVITMIKTQIIYSIEKNENRNRSNVLSSISIDPILNALCEFFI